MIAKKPSYISIADAPVLEPTPIYSNPIARIEKQNNIKLFNLSEFEDSNANPFELVELQTLDDIDELKSVLQPDSNFKQKKKETSSSQSNIEIDPDFSIFNNNKPTTAADNLFSQETAKSLLPGINSFDQSQSFSTKALESNKETVLSLSTSQNTRCTLPGAVSLYNTSVSPLREHTADYCKGNTMNNARENCLTQVEIKELQGSNTKLMRANSKSLPNLAEVGVERQNQGTWSPPNNCEEPAMSTSRIDNIMKQYQFTRVPMAETNNFCLQQQASDFVRAEGVPFQHHNLPRSPKSAFQSSVTNSLASSHNVPPSTKRRTQSIGDEKMFNSNDMEDAFSEVCLHLALILMTSAAMYMA